MRIRDKIDKKKLSHYLFNDEEIVCMNKKYFDDNYIHKDKIRKEIEETEKELYNGEILQKFAYIKIETLKELLEE